MTLRIRMFEPYVTDAARARVSKTLESGRISQGSLVEEFENEFERVLGIRHAVAVNSCSSALLLALRTAGIGPGDEVVTTAQTFIATALAILHVGARPVFADIEYWTGNLDPTDIERRISDRTKAILLVHWGGRPCNMEAITKLAEARGLDIIEDAAHAIGAKYQERPIGSHSRFTCFSFQAIKHITTGDGGMLVATRSDDADLARRLRWHGIDRMQRQAHPLGEPQWDVSDLGFKFQMNDIAAAMGIEHIRVLDVILSHRRELAGMYTRALAQIPGIAPLEDASSTEPAWWLYDAHVEYRDGLVRALRDRGVETSVVHRRIDRNTIFEPYRSELPVLSRFDATHLCLPLHNRMTEEDVEHVVESISRGW